MINKNLCKNEQGRSHAIKDINKKWKESKEVIDEKERAADSSNFNNLKSFIQYKIVIKIRKIFLSHFFENGQHV